MLWAVEHGACVGYVVHGMVVAAVLMGGGGSDICQLLQQHTLQHCCCCAQDAARRLSHESLPGCSSGFRRSRRPMFGSHLVLLALQKPGQKNMFTIVRPNTGEGMKDEPSWLFMHVQYHFVPCCVFRLIISLLLRLLPAL